MVGVKLRLTANKHVFLFASSWGINRALVMEWCVVLQFGNQYGVINKNPADAARLFISNWWLKISLFLSEKKSKEWQKKIKKETQIDKYAWIKPESPAFLPWWQMWWFYVILTGKGSSGLWLIFSSMSNICADFQSGTNVWITILTARMRFLHLVISTIATGGQSPPTGGPVRAGGEV